MTIGIYCIQNLINGKRYIGKSTRVEKRFLEHKSALLRQTYTDGTNRYLWASVKKYGFESFKFYILEIFNCADTALISDREIFWMDELNTLDRKFGYNLMRDSSSGSTHSAETRLNMSLRQKGVPKTKEHRAALSKGQKGVPRLNRSKEHSENAANANRKFSFSQYTLEGIYIRTFRTLGDVIKAGYGFQNIYAVCDGKRRSAWGYKWKKIPYIKVDTKQKLC